MCCDVAIARAYGTTRLITQEIEEEENRAGEAPKKANVLYLDQIKQRFPAVGQIVKETCGACMNFKADPNDPTKGRCHGYAWRNHEVRQHELKCQEYNPAYGKKNPATGTIIGY